MFIIRPIRQAFSILFKGHNGRRGSELSNKRGNGSIDKMKKATRKIDKIIIHCSATPPSMDIGVDEIRVWHKERGWSDIGYHYVKRRNGVMEKGRDINRMGAHVKGYNTGSIGICMVGGVDDNGNPEDNFTKKQWKSLRGTILIFKALYPNATIHGHNEFANKACPSFDVQYELEKGRLK